MGAASFSVPTRGSNPWSSHECTFETVEYVRCRGEAVDYLSAVHAGRAILTTPKAADDLSTPALGYVKTPLPVADPETRCPGLSRCGYYYELTTRSKKAESQIRRRLKRCGIRLVREYICRWRSPLSAGHAAVYRLVHRKRDRSGMRSDTSDERDE